MRGRVNWGKDQFSVERDAAGRGCCVATGLVSGFVDFFVVIRSWRRRLRGGWGIFLRFLVGGWSICADFRLIFRDFGRLRSAWEERNQFRVKWFGFRVW